MRIVAGALSGRQFNAPSGFKTHPMSDKARGALFNILGDIEGLTVLDAFAGSGALSFESASRGAAKVIAIDSDCKAQQVIDSNIRALGIEGKVKLIKASSGVWLQTNPNPQFDIVLCDPPYNDLQPNLLQRLARCVAPDGIVVLSWPSGVDLPNFEHCNLLERRHYGDMTLAFYRHMWHDKCK